MKKIVMMFIFTMSIYTANAQKYIDVMKNGICDCVESQQEKVNFENVMKLCFDDLELEQLLKDEYEKGNIEITLDSIKKVDDIFGKQMAMQLLTDLIVECDGMYKVFDNLRERLRIQKRAEKSMKYLDSLNQVQMTDKRDLFERGILNFSYYKYDKGIEDLKASLNNSQEDARILFTIGWVYEKKEDFKTALDYYNQASSMVDDPEILLFIKAMAVKMKQ